MLQLNSLFVNNVFLVSYQLIGDIEMVKSAVVVFPTECTDCARESSGGADDTGGGTTSDGAE